MGMALIFGVMRIVNFAHGAFMMLGMYATLVFYERLGINPFYGFIGAAAFLFVIGYAVYQGLLRRIAERSDFMQILLTLGIALILVDAVQLSFGADFQQITLPLRDLNLHFGPIVVNAPQLISFGITIVIAVAMFVFVMRTMLGRALRAIAQNRYAAPLMGIDVHRVQAISFAL